METKVDKVRRAMTSSVFMFFGTYVMGVLLMILGRELYGLEFCLLCAVEFWPIAALAVIAAVVQLLIVLLNLGTG
jgi:hypothetical protein